MAGTVHLYVFDGYADWEPAFAVRTAAERADRGVRSMGGVDGAERYVDEPAVSDGVLITAGGMAPLEFAREIFAALAIYDEDALESWYRLYKTGKSEHYARLARAAEPAT